MNAFALGLAGLILLVLAQHAMPRTFILTRVVRFLLHFTPLVLFACLLLTVRSAGLSDIRDPKVDYQRSGNVYLSFIGLERPLKGDTRIGGIEGSDFLVERVPGTVAVIDKQGRVRNQLVDNEDELFSAALGKLRDLSKQGLVKTWALKPGSKFCFALAGAAGCDPARTSVWSVGEGTRLNVSVTPGAETRSGSADGEAACRLSDHVAGFGFQSWFGRIPEADKRIFPLDIYGRPGCEGTAVAFDEDTALSQTFLHFDSGGRLFVSQLPGDGADQELVVVNGAAVINAPAPAGEPGAYRLSVFRVQAGSPLPKSEKERRGLFSVLVSETGRSRLVELNELEVKVQPGKTDQTGTLQIRPEQAPVAEIPAAQSCQQSTLANLLGARERTRALPADAAGSAGSTTVRVPFLNNLGQIGSAGALLDIRRQAGEVSPWSGHGCLSFSRASIALRGATGSIEDVTGHDVLTLGSAQEGRVLLSIAEYGVPGLAILAFLAGAGVLRLVLRSWSGPRLSQAGLAIAIIAVIDATLVVRLVIAVQEIAVHPEAAPQVVKALLALVLIPLLAELAMLGLGLLPSKWRAWLRRWYLPKAPPAAGEPAPSKAPRTWKVQFKALGQQARRYPLFALLLLTPVLHLALIFAGFRESLGPLRITSLVIPAYMALLAALVSIVWRQARQGGMLRSPFAWGTLALTGAIIGAAFVLAHDMGALITVAGAALAMMVLASGTGNTQVEPWPIQWRVLSYVLFLALSLLVAGGLLSYGGGHDLSLLDTLKLHPGLSWMFVALLLVAALAWKRWATWPRVLLGYPGALVLVLLLALSSARFDDAPEDCSRGDIQAAAQCLDKQSLKTNQLRLSYLIYPSLSRLDFSREARGMNSVFDELGWLIHTFKSQGFMGVPPRFGLDIYDNAIASHVMGPLGGDSAGLLCGVIALPAVLMIFSRRMRRSGLYRPLPWLAYFSFAFTSIYMVLGNALLVPFTGRNVYLTGAFSGSDLLEGGLLLLLVLVPLACGIVGTKSDQNTQGAKS